MACDLTHGRGIPCRNLIGGVKYVYFAKLSEITSITTVSSEVTDVDMGTNSVYRYAIRSVEMRVLQRL